MPLQPMGAWAPDALSIITDASQEQNVAGEALGVLPGPTSYRNWPSPAAASIPVGQSTVTITIASPGVVTWTAHNFNANDPIVFSTTSQLPTGITAGTTYYVLATGLGTNVFEFSTSTGGAAVVTTGSQSGTQTATYTGA